MDEQEIEAARSMILAGLPTRVRWIVVGTSFDFDFSEAQRGLRHVARGDFFGSDELDERWADHLIFGELDVCEGGGARPFLTIRTSDGVVCGLDVERDDSIYPFNSSVAQFIRTFVLFDQHLGQDRPIPADIGQQVRQIDPECFDRSEWRSMIDWILDP
jgi:hypothetical protein